MGIIISTIRHWVSGFLKNLFLSLLQANIKHGRVKVVIDDQRSVSKSETITIGAKDNQQNPCDLESTVVLTNDSNFWLRISQNLDIGFAEAYMLQAIDCDDLVKLFRIYIRNWTTLQQINTMFDLPMSIWTRVVRKANTLNNALQNASFHYDTSNELFASFLSRDMCYSCPIWLSPEDTLETAQRQKIHSILHKAQIDKTHHVLDIGGGWGFLAMEAVRLTGCRVTVITLSQEQKVLAEERIKAESLDDRITFLLCDYRRCPRPPQGYDRIISVEMIEAVGKEFLDEYFLTINNLLNPTHGRVVIQGITFIERLHKQPKRLNNFLDQYIFPGGYLPSANELINCLNKASEGSLEVDFLEDIGQHYVKALRIWREQFIANWDFIKASIVKQHGRRTSSELEALKRKWIYYFSYCQAGFHEGILGDVILSAARKPQAVSHQAIL